MLPICAYPAERAETERLIREITPPLQLVEDRAEKKDEWYVDSFYEPSDIIQGNRTGHWNELDTTFGYVHGNVHGYMSVSQLERFDSKDYTANFGSYFSLRDSYVHIEAGFGWDVDYIYKFQSIAEYGHKLYSSLFWQIGYNYRAYGTDDTHMIYPGLIYYFGDSYISADYGASCMEGHDTANFGTVKGDFALTDFLHWYCGIAFGERLYDIYGLEAHDEYGYIMFTGLKFTVYKGIQIKAGYSYGTEKPKFIKRAINFAASVKF
ncbi:MAG: YaiO family outer membrane beta-barrel protein [Candidatus Omnitrophota bacterium]